MATNPNFEDPEEVIEADFLFFGGPKAQKSKITVLSETVKVLSRNWMGSLKGDFKLRELYLLGSHDSAALCGEMKNQRVSILEQLNWGVRFLDLQVAEHENEVWLFYGVPCLTLKAVLLEINQFIQAQPTEKIIICLRKSLTCTTPLNWLLVKQCIEINFTAGIVSKAKVDANINEMDGNIILIAPNELHIEQSVDTDSIISYAPSENNLNDFLIDLTKGDLLKRKNEKLVWLECRSRNVVSKRVHEEVLGSQNFCFFNLKERLYFNIVSFSFIGKTHFSLLKEYFKLWNPDCI